MSNLIDISQQTFGRLTAVSLYSSGTGQPTRWTCICECGRECIVKSINLRQGNTKSCGCKTNWGNRIVPRGWSRLNKSCERRGWLNQLTIEQYIELGEQPCFYCNKLVKRDITAYCIDRVDNRVGYTFNNCVSCCIICNWMKGELNAQAFINKCREIAYNYPEP